MYINGKWMTEPEISNLVKELTDKVSKLTSENAELRETVDRLRSNCEDDDDSISD